MKRVILMRGLPASGKSTWVRQAMVDNPGRFKRISKDDLRRMLDDGKWGKANEKHILDVRDALILKALDAGYIPIVDDTNLAPKHLARITQLVEMHARVEVQDFTAVPVDKCIMRDQAWPNYVGERVIRQMYDRFIKPPRPEIVFDPALPTAIICDLDGTLALFGDANPYDRDFSRDRLNPPVEAVLRGVRASVIITSGRSDRFQAQTEQWLGRHGIGCAHLLMRPPGDSRKDSVLKREMYEQHIRGVYNILFVPRTDLLPPNQRFETPLSFERSGAPPGRLVARQAVGVQQVP